MSDMYARKKELFLDGMLGRLESAKTIRDRLAEAGFAIAKMQDASGTLAEWIGQQIFDGNLESVCAALGAERKILKEAGCGYFIAAAQPSGLWRTLSYVKEKSPFYQKKFTSVWGQLGKMEVFIAGKTLYIRYRYTDGDESRRLPNSRKTSALSGEAVPDSRYGCGIQAF